MKTKLSFLAGAALMAVAALLVPLTAGAQDIEPVEFWRGPSGGVPNNIYGPDAFVNQFIAKKFGLAVSVRFARENALTEFTLMRTTRRLPDMFTVPNVQVFSETARTGVLKALEEYYDDPNYPHLQQIPRVQLAFLTLDGHQYGIPIRYDRDLDNPSREVVPWLLMPRSIPGRLGIDAPETLDDLLAAMRAVRDGDLTSWTGQPMIPFGLGEAEPRWLITFGDRIYGAPGAGTRNVGNLQAMALHLDDGGRVVPSWGSVERREGMRLVNRLWRDGLLDPEAFTQKGDVVASKLANGRPAFWFGRWGGASAYAITAVENNPNLSDEEKEAWYAEHEATIIPVIRAAGHDSTPFGVVDPFPTNLSAINVKTSQSVTDKLMAWADWYHTDEGMFTNYYSGPMGTEGAEPYTEEGGMWYYDSDGTPRRNRPADYLEFRRTKYGYEGGFVYPYEGFFGYNWQREFLASGADYTRAGHWWYWLYGTQKDLIASGEIGKVSALNKLPPGPIESDLAPVIEDIWTKGWAKLVTAGSDAEFEESYDGLVQRLLATDWKQVVAERQMSWDTFLAENPGIAALGGFPTHTAIPEVDAQL
jgi:putative aldouronate transport system substrate-binding protein